MQHIPPESGHPADIGTVPKVQVIAAIRGTGDMNLSDVAPEFAESGLHARELDHLGPLLGFIGDELSESAGEPANTAAAQVGEACLYLGVGEGGIDLLVELVDDLGGRVLWARRCRTSRSPRSPAEIRPPSGRPAEPPERFAVVTASARSLPALMYLDATPAWCRT